MAASKRLRLPKGFQFILETLAREAIQNQPEDIHVFATECLEKLLKERQDTGRDPTLQESSQDRFGVHGASENIVVPDSAPTQDVGTSKQTEQASTQDELPPAQDVTHAEVTETTSIKDESAPVQDDIATTKDEPDDLQDTSSPIQDVPDTTEDMPTEPAEGAPMPFKDELEPVQNEVAPTEDKAAPAEDVPVSTQDALVSTEENATPAEGVPAPAQDAAAPTEDKATPAEIVPAPTQDAPVSTEDEAAPVEDALAPTEDKAVPAEDAPAPAECEEEEEIDIDLTDPEVNDAALKIQAGFRGHKSRKKVAELKSEKPKSPSPESIPNQETELEVTDSKDTAPSHEECGIVDEDMEAAKEPEEAEGKPAVTGDSVQVTEEEEEKGHLLPKPNAESEPVGSDPIPDTDTVKDNTDTPDAVKEDTPELPEHQTEVVADHPEQIPVEREEQLDTGTATVEELIIEKEEAEPAENGSKQDEEEEIDIDLNDPEVNDAALKIQAGFRGHKSRQKVTDMKHKRNSLEPPPNQDEGKDVEEDKNASAEVDVSAPTQVEVVNIKQDEDAVTADAIPEDVSVTTQDQVVEEEEEIDIDLTDPEVNDAAIKIQAGFRGHQSRKKVTKQKSDDAIEDSAVDPECASADGGDVMELLDLDT